MLAHIQLRLRLPNVPYWPGSVTTLVLLGRGDPVLQVDWHACLWRHKKFIILHATLIVQIANNQWSLTLNITCLFAENFQFLICCDVAFSILVIFLTTRSHLICCNG